MVLKIINIKKKIILQSDILLLPGFKLHLTHFLLVVSAQIVGSINNFNNFLINILLYLI